MDVLSALIAYEQKLTMCLSSSSFYCRLLGSKMRLFWVSVQIPLSGALPIRGDGLRGSHNGNWVGRWTNSDSMKRVRYQVAHLPTRVHTQLAEMGGFQLIFISFAVLTEEAAAFWGHRRGLSHCPCGTAETQQDLWLSICAMYRWATMSLMSYSTPSLVCRVKRVAYIFSGKASLCITAIFTCFEKFFCTCYHLFTSNVSSSDIGITVGIIRLKN